MVIAFVIRKTTFRQQSQCLSGKAFSSGSNSRIGKCVSNPSGRQQPLMAQRVGVIGGGLAGLSTAYHLLEKSPSIDITIVDRQSPGVGGASAVAGG
jgi:ribulose 1,5-bisphosphate synthetase/thiazole synthase